MADGVGGKGSGERGVECGALFTSAHLFTEIAPISLTLSAPSVKFAKCSSPKDCKQFSVQTHMLTSGVQPGLKKKRKKEFRFDYDFCFLYVGVSIVSNYNSKAALSISVYILVSQFGLAVRR